MGKSTGQRPEEALVLRGGAKPRKRKLSRDSWTARKERLFFAALVDSCNVRLAARRAKVSTSSAYARRARNATFRAGWERSLASGYAALELMLLERALHGVEKTVVARDGSTTVMRNYSDSVALSLLRMHRESAAVAEESVTPDDRHEACERIVARLQRLREREDGAVETKGLTDRAGLLRWALRPGSGQALVRTPR